MKQVNGWLARDGSYFETEEECCKYEFEFGRQNRIEELCRFLDSRILQAAILAAHESTGNCSESWRFGQELRNHIPEEMSIIATMATVYITKDEMTENQDINNSRSQFLTILCDKCEEMARIAADEPDELLTSGQELLEGIRASLSKAIDELQEMKS